MDPSQTATRCGAVKVVMRSFGEAESEIVNRRHGRAAHGILKVTWMSPRLQDSGSYKQIRMVLFWRRIRKWFPFAPRNPFQATECS